MEDKENQWNTNKFNRRQTNSIANKQNQWKHTKSVETRNIKGETKNQLENK